MAGEDDLRQPAPPGPDRLSDAHARTLHDDIAGSRLVIVDGADHALIWTHPDEFLRALTGGQLVSTGAWSEMTRWQPGPEGFYDDYGLGLGRYRFPEAQVVGHHGVWGAFAFWSPELDAVITGTVNTGRVDRRPLLAAVMRALTG